jgi:hypothetical protein
MNVVWTLWRRAGNKTACMTFLVSTFPYMRTFHRLASPYRTSLWHFEPMSVVVAKNGPTASSWELAPLSFRTPFWLSCSSFNSKMEDAFPSEKLWHLSPERIITTDRFHHEKFCVTRLWPCCCSELTCWARSGNIMCFLWGTPNPTELNWVLNKIQLKRSSPTRRTNGHCLGTFKTVSL